MGLRGGRGWLCTGLGALLALLLAPAQACDVPVYRYALERWPPSTYRAVVFHRGELQPEQEQFVRQLPGAAGPGAPLANVDVVTADVSGELSPTLRKLWQAQGQVELPWLTVMYPLEAEIEEAMWSGPLSKAPAVGLVDSPKRREIARQLAQGSAVVFLLLESGQRKKDDAAAKLLRTQLAGIQKKVEAWFAEAAGLAPDSEELLGRPVGPPRFSVLRLSRQEPGEQGLTTMLCRVDPRFGSAKEPVVFPVFGQGRVLCGMVGEEIDRALVERACLFLLGDCSCEVKAQNPGVDLLMTADWYAVAMGDVAALPARPAPAPAPVTAPARTKPELVTAEPTAAAPPQASAAPPRRAGEALPQSAPEPEPQPAAQQLPKPKEETAPDPGPAPRARRGPKLSPEAVVAPVAPVSPVPPPAAPGTEEPSPVPQETAPDAPGRLSVANVPVVAPRAEAEAVQEKSGNRVLLRNAMLGAGIGLMLAGLVPLILMRRGAPRATARR